MKIRNLLRMMKIIYIDIYSCVCVCVIKAICNFSYKKKKRNLQNK